MAEEEPQRRKQNRSYDKHNPQRRQKQQSELLSVTNSAKTAARTATSAAAAAESDDDVADSILAWLISLRIPDEGAQTYADALRDLGFDDMQSLREDTTEQDLHRIGMKPGHVRRVVKALSGLGNREAGGVVCDRLGKNGGWGRNLDAISGSNSNDINHNYTHHMCCSNPSVEVNENNNKNDQDDNNTQKKNTQSNDNNPDDIALSCHRCCVTQGKEKHQVLALAGLGPPRPGASLSIVTRAQGGGGGGAGDDNNADNNRSGRVGQHPMPRSWAPHSGCQIQSSLEAAGDDLNNTVPDAQKRTPRTNTWSTCARVPGHSGAVVPNKARSVTPSSSRRLLARMSKLVARGESEGATTSPIASRYEQETERSEGERSPPLPGGGRGHRHDMCVRAYGSMPTISSSRTARPSGVGVFQARDGGGGTGEDSGESTSAESDPTITEDLDLFLNAGNSSNDTVYTELISSADTAEGGTSSMVRPGDVQHAHSRPAYFRRSRKEQCILARGSVAEDTSGKGCQLLRMPSLTGNAVGSENCPGLVMYHPKRATARVPVTRRKSDEVAMDGVQSMSPLDTATGPQTYHGVCRKTRVRQQEVFSEKPRTATDKRERWPTAADADVGTRGLIGRGHVKTLQRIRSTGRIGEVGHRNFHASPVDAGLVRDSILDFSDGLTTAAAATAAETAAAVTKPAVEAEAEVPQEIDLMLEVDVKAQQRIACNNGRVGTTTLAFYDPSADCEAAYSVSREIRDGQTTESLATTALATTAEVQEEINLSSALHKNKSATSGKVDEAFSSNIVGLQPPSTESLDANQEGWGSPGGHDILRGVGVGGVCGGGGIAGLSLEISILPEQHVDQSFEFSDNGTLHIQGFVLKPDGMKSAPTPMPLELFDRKNSISRVSSADRSRSLRPPSLRTTFETSKRPPCGRDSSCGDGSGGGGGGKSACGGARALMSRRWGTMGLPAPSSTTTTPRRMRESTILLEEIGRGGGGTVHKAMHVPSMRLVAVKMMEVHDDKKRSQMIVELKALLSMNRVPLFSAAQYAIYDSEDGSPGSSESWSYSGENSPDWAINGEEYFGPGGVGLLATPSTAPTTGATATATMTPSSGGRTFSSSRGSIGCLGSGAGAGTPSSSSSHVHPPTTGGAGDPGEGTNQGLRTLERPGSTCGFPPGSRGSAGRGNDRGGSGGAISRPCVRSGDQHQRRETRPDSPVVAFHDAYTETERGCVCIVMEYMDGGTLQQFVSRGQALPERSLAAVARSVLRGLTDMHTKHQIHRDIKPSNILLDRHGRVKISDFGVVREFTGTGSLAKTFTGTVNYMSPERITESDYSYPSDVWSLGLVIMALALGEFPFPSSSQDGYFQIAQAIAHDPVPALSPDRFSSNLCSFVEAMMQRDPAERSTAPSLSEHSFLLEHHDCDRLVGIVTVPSATRTEVQSLLQKVVDYHLEASMAECGSFEEEAAAPPPSSCSTGARRRRPHIPPLRKGEAAVLAKQLQVTRTELVEEYKHTRKRAEQAWADGRVMLRRHPGQRGAAAASPPSTPAMARDGRRRRFSLSPKYVPTPSSATTATRTTSPPQSHACVETPSVRNLKLQDGGSGGGDGGDWGGFIETPAPSSRSNSDALLPPSPVLSERCAPSLTVNTALQRKWRQQVAANTAATTTTTSSASIATAVTPTTTTAPSTTMDASQLRILPRSSSSSSAIRKLTEARKTSTTITTSPAVAHSVC